MFELAGQDKAGLLADVTDLLSANDCKVRSAAVSQHIPSFLDLMRSVCSGFLRPSLSSEGAKAWVSVQRVSEASLSCSCLALIGIYNHE